MVSTTASLDWLQTLADVTRVRLLRLLEQGELSVSELCAVVQLPQSTVSRHLKVLVEEGWIASRREATTNLYRPLQDQWIDARRSLWRWVREEADAPTLDLDQRRLERVLAERFRSEAFFQSKAGQWDQLRVELFGGRMDAFALAATLPRNAVVAELGCGSAPLCQLIAPFVAKAYAVDNSDAMLSAARQQLSSMPNVTLHRASLTGLPLENESLDAAWMVLVLPYVDDTVTVLAEASRVLKDEALLVIVDLLPHDREAYRQEMGHRRLGISEQELRDWLDGGDLQLDRYHVLPPEPLAKGPGLFVAIARPKRRAPGN